MISLVNGNSIHVPLKAKSVHMVAFSPPYWGLRSYLDTDDPNKAHELGGEGLHDCLGWARGERPCGACFVCNLREVAAEVWRVLRDDGTFWLNLGDSYASGSGGPQGKTTIMGGRAVLAHKKRAPRPKWRDGGSYTTLLDGGRETQKRSNRNGNPAVGELKPKDLAGVPWRVALALQADGWFLRNDVIWSKTNPMPESVTDRLTNAHEHVFLFAKQERYFFDQDAVREPVADSTVGRGPVDFGGEKGRGYKPSNADPNYRNGHEQWGRTFDYRESCINGRNRRTVWDIPTEPYPGAHFATWPTALVEIMVKAGTSERGCCSLCGAQWRRVVEKSEALPAPSNPNPVTPYPAASHTQGAFNTTLHMVRHITHTDWIPGCTCQQEFVCSFCSVLGGDEDGDCIVCGGAGKVVLAPKPIPAVVLDLFAGSGTTLVVARGLGRSAVGIDLNFKYLNEQARARLDLDRLEAMQQGRGIVRPESGRRAKKQNVGQIPLLP